MGYRVGCCDSGFEGTIVSRGILGLASVKGSEYRAAGWKRPFVLIGMEVGSRQYECGLVLRFGERMLLKLV